MEVIFVRHGEANHTIDMSFSLYIEHPSLTIKGEHQTNKLINRIDVKPDDLIIASPTLRTIETASILSKNISSDVLIHPIIGPRIFPESFKKNTLPCDYLVSLQIIEKNYPTIRIPKGIDSVYWQTGVINVLSSSNYVELLSQFINWLKSLDGNRVIVVTHDGTINWIRERLTRKHLTRRDFLPETGFIKLQI